MFYLTHPRHVARVLRQFDVDADAARTPALDVSEDDKGYRVTVDMPGVAKEAVKVRVEGRRVSIETATEVGVTRLSIGPQINSGHWPSGRINAMSETAWLAPQARPTRAMHESAGATYRHRARAVLPVRRDGR